MQPLVGGYAENGFIFVWQTCDSAVTEVGDKHFRSHASIGIGSHLAEYLLDHMFSPGGGEAHLVMTAAYVMREIGKSIAQVGLNHYITLFRKDGTVDFFYDSDFLAFDRFFGEFSRFLKHSCEFVSDSGPTRMCPFTDKRMTDYTLEVKQLAENEWGNVLRRRDKLREWIKNTSGKE